VSYSNLVPYGSSGFFALLAVIQCLPLIVLQPSVPFDTSRPLPSCNPPDAIPRWCLCQSPSYHLVLTCVSCSGASSSGRLTFHSSSRGLRGSRMCWRESRT
jgi:hypothetical protein